MEFYKEDVFSENIEDASTALEEDDTTSQGITFKSFEIDSKIGNGTYGVVYKAFLKSDQKRKPYAMKVQNKINLIKKKNLKYAVGEANIMKKTKHPFILQLHYAFQTPTNLYLALEYCPNGDLNYHLSRKEVFDEALARFYVAEVALALEYIH